MFLAGKGQETKAFHHKLRRVGLQESSPQNNFRRIIAALVEPREFFNHTVNYCTERSSSLDLRFVLAVLNSLLSDWYFRLGSTNAHVSHYQLANLPCPHFREQATPPELASAKQAVAALAAGQPDKAAGIVRPLTETAPFSPALREVVMAAVDRIVAAEANRGDIRRVERSELAPEAQPHQDFLDDLFFRLAGLTPDEVVGLRRRYEEMKKVK